MSPVTGAQASTPLAAEVAAVTAQIAGESSADDLLALALVAHVASASAGHIVVVGAGFGRAALALGAVARATGRGRVFAIDLFPDTEETGDPLGWTLDGFLGQVVERGLIEYVLPHHGTAGTFAHLMPEDFRCGLILLESAHACTEIGGDLVALEHHLAPGGWLCVDAAFSSFPGASDALDTLLQQRGPYDLGRRLTDGLFAVRKRA